MEKSVSLDSWGKTNHTGSIKGVICMAKKSARKRQPRPAVVKFTKQPTNPYMLLAALVLLAISALFLKQQIQTYKSIQSGNTTFVIPDPKANKAPSIDTYAVKAAILGKSYSTTIIGSDPDTADDLTMTVVGMPLGIKNTGCTKAYGNGSVQSRCVLSGVPTQKGTFSLSVILRDGAGHTVKNEIPLDVK